MSSMHFVVFAAVLAFACGDLVQHDNFAGYGPSFGDARVSSCDDCYFGPYNFDFIFYGDNRSSLYVSNNGIISFDGGISQFTPVGMSGANFPAIAVFWGDVYTSIGNGGSVWVGLRSDAAILASLSSRVGSTFHANRAFVVTYDNVAYFSANNKHNNFQAVLLADAIGNSWVLFNYAGMEWTTGSASGGSNGLGGIPASVGFSNGAGIYVQTPESLTADVLNTRDSVTQVNGVTIVIPPSQVCGNAEREGTEQCDGDACCNDDCTFKNDASCFCARQTYVGGEYAMNYFCVEGDTHSFYQCLQGPWASQSRIMPCGAGTACGCPIGEDCSCGGARTPCITEGDSFYC